MPGAQRLFRPWPRTPLGQRQVLLKDIFRALRQKPCLLFGSSLRTFSSGNWTPRRLGTARGGGLEGCSGPAAGAYNLSTTAGAGHSLGELSPAHRPAATTSWGREPCDRHLPPRRACGVQLAERLRAARTQTEPRRSSESPKPYASSSGWTCQEYKVLPRPEAPASSRGPGPRLSGERGRGVLWGIPGGAGPGSQAPAAVGGAPALSPPPSPEVDLIPASFAGAQQHRRGPVRARSSCLQTDPRSRKTDQVTTLAPTSRFQVSACNFLFFKTTTTLYKYWLALRTLAGKSSPRA